VRRNQGEGGTDGVRSFATAGDRLKDEEPMFGEEPEPNPLRVAGIGEKTVVRAYRARMLQAHTEFFTTTKPGESFSQTSNAFRAVETKWGRADDPTHAMNRRQFGAYENLEELPLRRDSKSGPMEAFLKVLEFRTRTGKFPKDLVEAGGSATDAFHQGRAFKYVVDGGYFRVNSEKNLMLEWPEDRVRTD
jgi:hypothetical protein